MAESRTNNVNTIRDRIVQSHYEVNAAAVAAAIIERLLAGNLLTNDAER